jgi:hypothetical protein
MDNENYYFIGEVIIIEITTVYLSSNVEVWRECFWLSVDSFAGTDNDLNWRTRIQWLFVACFRCASYGYSLQLIYFVDCRHVLLS